MKKEQYNLFEIILYGLFTLLVIGVARNPFFWDTIQYASKQGNYFYATNFQSIIVPGNIDSGHIPSLGIYLALVWKVFGKSLIVSHLAMLPFVWGIVYQSIKLSKQLFSKQPICPIVNTGCSINKMC